MKLNTFTSLILLLLFTTLLQAQKTAVKKYPDSFTISKVDFEKLFTHKKGALIINKNNPYLNKAKVEMNTLNGDMKYLRLRLSSFANAFLVAQVNGVHSTQVFVTSDDRSVFYIYKAKSDTKKLTMVKCAEDDIVSE